MSWFRTHRWPVLTAVFLLFLPAIDLLLPRELQIGDQLRPIFIFAILGLGLNMLTGYTGLLNLGVAAFMAIGAYAYGILTCDIYPFQIGFWLGSLFAMVISALAGVVLGLPTIRLRGDYLALVTLGFGEIVQELLKNLESITKGTQGINPLPTPTFFSYQFSPGTYQPWYYLLLLILLIVILINRNLEHSRVGRSWIALREDELAATCMGLRNTKLQLLAFALCAGLCGLAGALSANHLGSTGEPGNYDFQVSVLALCIVIVGGMGSIAGVLIGALVMVGFNSIVLVKLSGLFVSLGVVSTGNVFSSPNNYKYMIFGLALVLMMRFRPEGLLPSGLMRAELHEADATPTVSKEQHDST